MKVSNVFRILLFTLACTGVTQTQADVKFFDDTLSVYGDFRFRFESDWDSQDSDGNKRDDRERARIRVRLGFNYDITPNFAIGARIRTGANDSQQSPHITIEDFSGNNTGAADVNFDKWYVKTKFDDFWAWAGRNSFPFWKQNELFWDDDVTPAGLAAGYKFKLSDYGKLAVNAGVLALPAGMDDFSGLLSAGQLVYSNKFDPVTITLASGVYGISANRNSNGAKLYISGNGARDYTIWVTSLQVKLDVLEQPLVVGFDYMHNFEEYSPTDIAHDDLDGFVASIKIGRLKKQFDVQAGYYYAYIETYAVNNSFSQDDWVRWGSATQTRGSNMKGHELRLSVVPFENINIVARTYFVEAIRSVEDGNRFRVDLNMKF